MVAAAEVLAINKFNYLNCQKNARGRFEAQILLGARSNTRHLQISTSAGPRVATKRTNDHANRRLPLAAGAHSALAAPAGDAKCQWPVDARY